MKSIVARVIRARHIAGGERNGRFIAQIDAREGLGKRSELFQK